MYQTDLLYFCQQLATRQHTSHSLPLVASLQMLQLAIKQGIKNKAFVFPPWLLKNTSLFSSRHCSAVRSSHSYIQFNKIREWSSSLCSCWLLLRLHVTQCQPTQRYPAPGPFTPPQQVTYTHKPANRCTRMRKYINIKCMLLRGITPTVLTLGRADCVTGGGLTSTASIHQPMEVFPCSEKQGTSRASSFHSKNTVFRHARVFSRWLKVHEQAQKLYTELGVLKKKKLIR